MQPSRAAIDPILPRVKTRMTSTRRAELVPVQQGIDTQIAGNLRGRPTRLDHTASALNCGLNFRRRSGMNRSSVEGSYPRSLVHHG
jgi:hypothetical protein